MIRSLTQLGHCPTENPTCPSYVSTTTLVYFYVAAPPVTYVPMSTMSRLSSTLSHGSDNLLAIPPAALVLEAILEDTTVNTGENAQVFTSNVTFSFSHNDSTINERVASLFGRLLSHDKNLQILPIETAKHLNPIVTPSNVPTDEDVFSNYFCGMSQNSKTTQFYATVVSSLRINQLKHTKGTFEYLRKYGIYLKYNQIRSTQVKSIGWLYNQHPEAVSRNELKDILSSMLGGFDQFQLNARDVSLSRDSKLRTRGWVLEMDQTDADERIETILEKCHLGARLTLVPFMDPSAWDTNGAAETFFIKQNQMLRDSQVININGLKGLNEFTSDAQGKPITLREAFQVALDGNNNPLFSSISQVNSKRVCFLTTQDNYHQAVELIDDFIDTFVPALVTQEDRAKFLFDGKDPIRVGKRAVPKTISTYMSHLKDFSLDLDDDSRTTLSLPPSRRIRGQRSYMEVTKTTIGTASQPLDLTASTASETASFGSSFTDFEAKLQLAMDKLTTLKDKIDSNQTRINEQSEASGARMTKIEESVLKSFDSLNNLAKQQDSLQQSITVTNVRLDNVTTLLEAMAEKQMVEKGPKSPTRKNRKTGQAEESEPPGEPAMEVELT